MNTNTFNTEILLGMIAKVQQIRKAAGEMSFQAGSDPRYSAVKIKAEDLIEKLKVLVAPVMLKEIEALQALAKELYEAFDEPEQSEITRKDGKRGN